MNGGTQEQAGGEANAYSAAPSALGYLAQVEYALLLVLKRLDVELEFDVSIETLDDIVFHNGADAAELLQTKHRVDRTASLTNSSTDVWKTFHNWIVDGPSNATLTLLTNAIAPEGSAMAYLRGESGRDPTQAVTRLESVARTSENQGHQPYYQVFLELGPEGRLEFLSRVTLNLQRQSGTIFPRPACIWRSDEAGPVDGSEGNVREPDPSRLRGSMVTVRLRALVLVVMALALAACSSSPTVAPTTTTVPKPLPAIDLSATPTGWVPVAYGGAQVSVRASFYVYYPGWTDCGLRGNALYLGPATPSAIGCGAPSANPRTTTRVFLRHIDGDPTPYRGEKPVNLNGVAVYEVPSYGPEPVLDYYAPSIGVEVLATGPLARRIANTLTRSPRTVALASGPAPAVPSSWHQVTFAGLRFSVPAGWRTYRWVDVGICSGNGPTLGGDMVSLTNGTHLSTACQQPVELPIVRRPGNGVQVDVDPSPLLVAGTFSTNCLSLHGLIVCPVTSPAYSILVLKVTVPGRSKPVYVSIGLAGNGMVARTILYSLRAA